MAKLFNLARMTTATTGTGTITLGAAVSGLLTFAQAKVVNGDVVSYAIKDGANSEVGIGTYTASGTTLSRDIVRDSTNAGAKINLSGTAEVAISALAEDLIQRKRNYVINGAMMVSQRNGTTAGTTSSYYPVDRFAVVFSNSGAISTAQVASLTPAGSPNRLRVTVTSADASVAAGDYLMIDHKIEGYRVADLKLGNAAAKQFIIQFGVKAPAGTYSLTLLNSAANRSYVAEYVISGGEANTDVVKTATFTGDTTGTWLTTNGTGIYLRFGLMAGTTYQQAAGSWGTANAVGSSNQFNFMGTIANVFELFDVGLYEGVVAPPFEVPDFARTELECQRYVRKLIEPPLKGIISGATNFGRGSMPISPVMRGAPSVTISGSMPVFDGIATSTINAILGNYSTADSLELDLGGASGLNANRPGTIYKNSGSGFFLLESEL